LRGPFPTATSSRFSAIRQEQKLELRAFGIHARISAELLSRIGFDSSLISANHLANLLMKTKSSKQPKSTSAAVQLKDLNPKKNPKAGGSKPGGVADG
jgi:hypothetical protein